MHHILATLTHTYLYDAEMPNGSAAGAERQPNVFTEMLLAPTFLFFLFFFSLEALIKIGLVDLGSKPG